MVPMLDLPGLLKWWRELKPHWKWSIGLIGLAVVGAVTLLYTLMQRTIVDPVEKADKRAAAEEKTRAATESKIATKLREDVAEVKEDRDAAAEASTDAAVDLQRDLAEHPDALGDAMARVGRGDKP